MHNTEGGNGVVREEDKQLALCLITFKFMVSLSKACPIMLKKAGGQTKVLVGCVLEGMGEFEGGILDGWLADDVCIFASLSEFMLMLSTILLASE